MNKTHSKKQKLKWIHLARARWNAENPFTCNCFELIGGVVARKWYSAASLSFINPDDKCYFKCVDGLEISDFNTYAEGLRSSNQYEENGARQLWMAMLKTLVEDNQI